MIEYEIVEGVESVWSYHIAEWHGPDKALCGRNKLMMTKMPMTAWGIQDHIPSKWCSKCRDSYDSIMAVRIGEVLSHE